MRPVVNSKGLAPLASLPITFFHTVDRQETSSGFTNPAYTDRGVHISLVMFRDDADKYVIYLRATSWRWFNYAVLGVLCSTGALGFITTLFNIIPMSEPEERMPLLAFWFFWNLFVFGISYWELRTPTEISVTKTGKVVLRSPVRTLILTSSQITRIECDYEGSCWTLHHMQGKVRLYNKYSDFDKFLKWLTNTNANVRVPDDVRRK